MRGYGQDERYDKKRPRLTLVIVWSPRFGSHMDILLIRHGATEWSELGKHTGRTDIPLTSLGEAQARALGSALGDYTIVKTLVSPLQRAQRTAELAGLPHRELAPDLVEVDYGEDEGLTTAEIRKKGAGWSFFKDGAHGGETFAEVAARVMPLLDTIAAMPGPSLATTAGPSSAQRQRTVVACVAHGHLLRILTALFLREDAQWGGHLGLGTASIGLLGYEHGTPAIVRWNDQSHLRDVR